MDDLLDKLTVYTRDMKKLGDEIALQRAVRATRLKIIAEIADDQTGVFDELAMNHYKHFARLPAPFVERWKAIKTKLNITKDEKTMSRMEKDIVADTILLVQGDPKHSFEELVAVARTLKHSNYYLFFLELNKKMNELRPGDDLFQTQEKAFII